MINEDNFITIQGWMRTRLNLTGTELITFAVIYGFSQDGDSVFGGSAQYIADWCGIDKRHIYAKLKSLCEKGYIQKIQKKINDVTLNDYKVSPNIHEVMSQGMTKCQGGYDKTSQGGMTKCQGGYDKTSHHNIEDNIEENIEDRTTTTRFRKPTIDEIEEYLDEKGYTFSAEQFYFYYESNGWKVGRNPMKDWKSACRTWQAKEKPQQQKQSNNNCAWKSKEEFLAWVNNG